MTLKILIIRTDFKHHGKDSGYKQILNYIHPYRIFGINEREENVSIPYFKLKYQWLYEFDTYKNKGMGDLVHILYGEDYFRWSTKLFTKIPVVATFHQPADLLEREVIYGDYRGRIGKLTHLLSKNRFKKLAAAIVTNSSQKEVLKRVMPEDKIHVIPLGIHLEEMKKRYDSFIGKKQPVHDTSPTVITVGHWLRDWDFYFKIVKSCKQWKFRLVNQKLDEKYIQEAKKYENLTYYSKISDDEMFDLFLDSDVQFIPVTGMAASNAFIQGLALGCPLVLTDINADQYKENKEIISLYEPGSSEDCIKKLGLILNLQPLELKALQHKSHLFSHQFSWEEVANKTMQLYLKLV